MLSYGDYAIPLLSLGLGLAGYWWLAKWRNRVEAFSSFKEAAKAKTANPNSRAAFKALRALRIFFGEAYFSRVWPPNVKWAFADTLALCPKSWADLDFYRNFNFC